MSKLQFTITPEQLGLLGSLVKEEKTKISPLNQPAETSLEEAADELGKAGIIDEEGKLTEKAALTIGTLARARVTVGINFTGLPGPLEYVLYLTPGGNEAVSVTATSEGLVIEDPGNPLPVAGLLKDCLGESKLHSSNLDVELEDRAALVLGTLMDIRRKSIFRALAEETPAVADETFTFAEIHNRVNQDPRPDRQWLRSSLRQLIHEPVKLSQTETLRALDELVAGGHISTAANADEYLLTGDAAIVANRLQVIKGLLSVSANREDDTGRVFFSEFTALQSGAFDLLYLEHAGGKFHMQSLPPSRILELCNIIIKETLEVARKTKDISPEKETSPKPPPVPEWAAKSRATTEPPPPPMPNGNREKTAKELSPSEKMEEHYRELKGQLDAGTLTPAGFRSEVNRLRLQDNNGTWWQIRQTDGKWLKWTGTKWVE